MNVRYDVGHVMVCVIVWVSDGNKLVEILLFLGVLFSKGACFCGELISLE